MATLEVLSNRSNWRRTLAESLTYFDEHVHYEWCDGPRYRIRYAILGEGPTLVNVPGICCQIRIFAPLLVSLAERFRVVAYDLVGVTPGDQSQLRTYQLDDYAEDLLVLADHLDLGELDLLAHSFGTTISMRTAYHDPERVRQLMLVGGFAYRPLRVLERLLVYFGRRFRGPLSSLTPARMLSRWTHAGPLDARERGLMEFMLGHQTMPIRTAAYQSHAVDTTDLRHAAKHIAQPTLIVHGQADHLVPPHHAAELATLIPNSRLHWIADSGHMPYLSHPEELAELAEEFFQPTLRSPMD